MKMRAAIVLLLLSGLIVSNSPAGDSPTPLEKIERKIAKEPGYVAPDPGYLLYVLDLENRTRVWAVLDKSNPKAARPDVLYIDLNANGDLTEAGERFTSDSGAFSLGDFVDPVTKDRHTDLKLRVNENGSVMFGLNWKGRHRVGGGYAVKPGPYTLPGKSPDTAPIIKLVGEGLFSFQTWMAPAELKIGGATDIKFFVGHPGMGPNTFSAVMHPFLPPDVALEATLLYENAAGRRAQTASILKDRC